MCVSLHALFTLKHKAIRTMAVNKSKKPHVLAVPFPAQGHVKPLMKLCQQVAKRGIKVTFVNIESMQEKVLKAAFKDGDKLILVEDNLTLVSVPDGRGPEEDPNDIFILLETLRVSMPGHLTELIEKINGEFSDEQVSCVIADVTIGWVLETAEKMGAEPVLFSPPSAAAMALVDNVSKLVDDGMLDSNGSMVKGETITLSDTIPSWKKNELSWSFCSDLRTQKIFFDCSLVVEKSLHSYDQILTNTFYDLEPSACDLNKKLVPIGPLLENNSCLKKSSSSTYCTIHEEDTSCLSWLDTKPHGSVVYVSFGSLAMFSQQQLDELAHGLELSGRPFLWVARSDLANGSRVVYPDGFLERNEGMGKIVEWAPQERVLNHSSVGCFVSHCGWNSTLEGLSSGVPFLCWPYFSDQFCDQNYVCDQWEIGLRIEADENGIRTRDEIVEKIEMVLVGDVKFKENALKLKELAAKSVGEGGSSSKNFEAFVERLWK